MKIERIWAMPNKWTFTIKPIKELLEREVGAGLMMNGLWCDPFCGQNSPAQITNDLNPNNKADFHLDALEFLKQQERGKNDGVLLALLTQLLKQKNVTMNLVQTNLI